MQTCTINRIRIGGNEPVRLMGVVNCSPESFFSGSYTSPDGVRQRALDLMAKGAEIIDIGGRSTAPRASAISADEERRRIDAALSALDGSGITVTVDTVRPEVLETALSHDIHAVNDISGLSDPTFAKMISESGLPAVLMASIKSPGDAVGIDATLSALEVVIRRCGKFGIREFVLDPAIGLWTPQRSPENDWDLCRHFSLFTRYDRPLLAAISRKTFIGDLLGKEPEGRLSGSLALTLLLVQQGASMVRTHDVAATADALKVLVKMRGEA